MLLRLFLLLLLCAHGGWSQSGRFVVRTREPQSAFGRAFYRDLVENPEHRLVKVVDVISNTFQLPRDFDILFIESGRPDCYYDPEQHHIVVSYEFIDHIYREAASLQPSAGTALSYAEGTVMFSLLHEIGHCLFYELNMPIVGREEDAADEFATILLVGVDWAASYLVGAAEWFEHAAQNQSQSALDFWDEHSLDQQRVYNILLMLYAESPERYAALVSGRIPARRLERARLEHRRKYQSWNTLLKPHMK